MTRNTIFKLLGLLIVLSVALSASAFSQVYVSATNGDDTFGNGTSGSPYRTITKAITVATTGSTIDVEAGVYNSVVLPGEANPITLAAAKTLTFVGTAVGVNTTVELTDGFVLNDPAAVVDFGSTGTAKFNFGASAGALVLTAGSMTSAQAANVVIGSGATITITAGTLNFVPTTGSNLSVVFDGTTSISSTSGFMPSSFGTGTLTINKASGAITIDNGSISLTNLVHSGAANATFSGSLTVAAGGDITNSSTGTTTLGTTAANTLTMTYTEATSTSIVTVSGGGSVVVNSVINYSIANTKPAAGDGTVLVGGNIVALTGASNFTANGNVNFINTNAPATNDGQNDVAHTVTLSNGGTGTLALAGVLATPVSTATFTTPASANNAYVSVILSNTGTGTFTTRTAATRGATGTVGVINNGSGKMTLGQTGDTFSTSFDVMNDGATAELTINAASTFSSATVATAFVNNNAASQVIFGANSTIAGGVDNNGKIKLNTFTLTLSEASGTALDNTGGDIFSVTTGVTGSGLVKLTGASGVIVGTGNLPNVELANTGTVSTAGNTIWGDLVISSSGTYTVGASNVKGDLNKSGSGGVTFNGTAVGGSINLTGGGTLTIGGATAVTGAVNMTSGSITLGANLTVTGTFTMPQGTFTFGAFTLDLKGDFNRTGGTIGAAQAGTGTLQFSGAKSQSFTPGTQMNVYNVVVNNIGNFLAGVIEDDKVTINASLLVHNDFTITDGKVILGTSNIRMLQGAGNSARFTNGDRGYDATGVGGVIFEGTGALGAAGTGSVLAGTQPFSNIFVRLSVAANNVYCLGAVKISGVVTLDGGGIIWNAADNGGDLFTASTLTLDDTFVVPTVVVNTQNGHGSPFLVDGADGGAAALAITSVYNLTYTGQTAASIAADEFISTKVNNLSILAGTAGKTITFVAAPGTIVGALTVDNGETFNLNAQTLTASSNTAVHTVNGTVSNGTLLVTGTGASLVGGSGTGNASSVAALTVAPAAGGTFTSTGMKVLTTVIINQAALTSTITMNSATATVASFTNTAGTTALSMNSTASSISGNFLVTAGAVTLTMNGAAAGTRTIGGTLDVNGGSLTLGSHIDVTGAASQTGSLVLGDFNLTLADNYTHAGTGSITAGTGAIVAKNAAPKNYTFTTTVTIPNLTLNSTGGGIVVVTAGFTVSGKFVHTDGDLNLGTLPFTFSGGSYTFTTGTYTSGGAAGKVALTGAAVTIDGTGNPSIPFLEVNTTGTVTINPNTTTSPATSRSVTVSSGLTQTKGEIALGTNDLVVTGGAYAYTAGTITATTSSSVVAPHTNIGELVFNGGTGFTVPATPAISIPNLRVDAAITVGGTATFTVTNRLTFGANIGLGAADRLVLSDGAIIVRTVNAGTLSHAPAFGATVDVVYLNGALAATIVTGIELPTSATVLRNLTVNLVDAGGGSETVTLSANVTVNGTLFLVAGILDRTTNSKSVTLADGSTLSKEGPGSINGAVTPAGAYSLIYTGTGANVTTSNNEWPSAATITNLSITIGNSAGAGTDRFAYLHANRTVGTLTLNGATANSGIYLHTTGVLNAGTSTNLTVTGATTIQAGKIYAIADAATTSGQLIVQGDVNMTGGGFGTGAVPFTGQLTFSGASDQAISLSGNQSVGNVRLDKTGSPAPVVTLGGTSVTLSVTGTMTFINGLLSTGDNVVRLSQGALIGQQGFDRSGLTGVSHIVGSVRKAVTNVTGGNDFPVGTTAAYRPATVTFSSNVAGLEITVSHSGTSPSGIVGLPIPDGVTTGTDIARYAPFYWNIRSNASIGATPFSLGLTAEGFTDYDAIANVRIVRRVGAITDVTNPWTSPGFQYENFVFDGVPTVTAVNLTGAIVPGGSIFTYGLKSNMVVSNPFTVPTLTDAASTFTRDLLNPVLVSGNTGQLSFTATVDHPTIASASITNNVLTVTALTPGSTILRITATDAADGSRITYSTGVTSTVTTSVETVGDAIPTEFSLNQNFPNPFNPSTTIRFALPSEAPVSLVIYNMLGVPVRTLLAGENLRAAYHQIAWDGKDEAGYTVPSGLYIYRITAGSFQSAKRMTLLK